MAVEASKFAGAAAAFTNGGRTSRPLKSKTFQVLARIFSVTAAHHHPGKPKSPSPFVNGDITIASNPPHSRSTLVTRHCDLEPNLGNENFILEETNKSTDKMINVDDLLISSVKGKVVGIEEGEIPDDNDAGHVSNPLDHSVEFDGGVTKQGELLETQKGEMGMSKIDRVCMSGDIGAFEGKEVAVGGDGNIEVVTNKIEAKGDGKHSLVVSNPLDHSTEIDREFTKQGQLLDTQKGRRGMLKEDRLSVLGHMGTLEAKEAAVGGDCRIEVGKNKIEAKGDDARSLICYDDLGIENPGKSSFFNGGDELDGRKNGGGDKVDGKKKRGGASENRKEKKKMARRRKRAEEDKRSGVKRLKLQPITIPKTVKYCDFFLKGKCQKGDSCTFSHDTTPLTKSQPCRFFAQRSCLKGDDCPFDHQLSKYPCDNYQAKGFCIRGEKCLFSHKMEGSSPASNTSATVSEASTPAHSLNSGTQTNRRNTSSQIPNLLKKTPTSLSSLGTVNTRRTGPNVAEARFSPPAQPPKGISVLLFGNVASEDTGKVQKGALPSPHTRNSNGPQITSSLPGVSEKSHSPNEMRWRAPTSIQSQSLKVISDGGKSKDTPNSTQKALSSTLAFASKYESQVMVRSPALNVASEKGSKSCIGSSNGSVMTVTDILQQFLFHGGAGGHNSKQ